MATEYIFQNSEVNTSKYTPDHTWVKKDTRVASTQNIVPDQPWGIKERTRRAHVPKHGWRRARRTLPVSREKESPLRRSLADEGNVVGTPCPNPAWLCGQCQVCGTPNVIGCEHQDPTEEDDSDTESLKSVETGPVRYASAPLWGNPHQEEWELRRALGDIHVSMLLGEELIQFQLPQATTFANIIAFTELMLPDLPCDGHRMRYDVYLPGASRFMDMQTLYERHADELVNNFLDHGILRMRGSICLDGGKRKVGKPTKPKGKKNKKGKKPKQSQLMGQNFPNQEAMVKAMFGVRIPKQVTRGNGGKQKLPSSINSTLAMSACTAKFLRAVVDPFGERNVCLPTLPAAASLKASGFIRFTMVSGGTAVGGAFVSVNPTWTNDLHQGYFTSTNAYVPTGNVISVLSANNTLLNGVGAIVMNNLPYGTSAVTGYSGLSQPGATLLQGRVVACGLRVTYVGTTINESGVSYCYVDPQHQNIYAMSNAGALLGSLHQTDVKGVTRDPCNISVFPISELEMNYPTDNPINATGSSSTNPTEFFYNMSQSAGTGQPLGAGGYGTNTIAEQSSLFGNVVVPGAIAGYYSSVSAPSSFLVEMIVHVEYIGPTVASFVSPNISDPTGLAHAVSVLQQMPVVKQANPHLTLKETMLASLREIASQLKPVAVSAVVKGLSMLMV